MKVLKKIIVKLYRSHHQIFFFKRFWHYICFPFRSALTECLMVVLSYIHIPDKENIYNFWTTRHINFMNISIRPKQNKHWILFSSDIYTSGCANKFLYCTNPWYSICLHSLVCYRTHFIKILLGAKIFLLVYVWWNS